MFDAGGPHTRVAAPGAALAPDATVPPSTFCTRARKEQEFP